MGEWGAGNFEQDYSLDFIFREVQQPLLRKIQQMVDNPVYAEADEPDSGPIMAAVEILVLLSEHANAAPPKPDDVAHWKQVFLKAWDGTAADVYFKESNLTARRAVIAATFDRLMVCSTEFHKPNA